MWLLSVLEIHIGGAIYSLAFRLDKNCSASWSFVEVIVMFVTAAPLLIAEAPLTTR